MSLDVFKKARHMRRIEEYKDITISAENSALIIHSNVTVQLLDEDGKVLRSEKKSHQQKLDFYYFFRFIYFFKFINTVHFSMI